MKQKSYSEISYISIREPWVWLIMEGYKDIENRGRPWKHRGELLIHASSNQQELLEDLEWVEEEHGIIIPKEELNFGAFVGMVDMIDCVDTHSSDWFSGEYGFVLENPRRIEPIAYKANAGPQKAYEQEIQILN